jgi:capsular polysaccharide biosynthesis protein
MNKNSSPRNGPGNITAHGIRVKTVSNCIVTPSMIALRWNGVDTTSLAWYLSRRQRLRTNMVALASIIKNGIATAPNGMDYFHIFNTWGTGYYHWLTEIAPKLLIFEDMIRQGTILLPKSIPTFVTEFFKLFQFSNIHRTKRCLFLRGLNVVTDPPPGQHSREYLAVLRSRVFSKLDIRPDKPVRRIYVSRLMASRRRVANEQQVIELMEDAGFECVCLEDLTFGQQVEMFSNCSKLVTIHGAAIANSVFMPPGSRVVELFPRPSSERDYVNPCFANLCDSLSVSHEFHFCARSHPEEQFNFHTNDLLVDLAGLAKVV